VSVAEQLDPPGDEEAPPASSELFRAVNERIRELAGTWDGEYDFMCECEDEECTRVLRLTEEYAALRADPGQFAVLPGHERRADEVISRGDRYVMVRKQRVNGEEQSQPERR
jgi:hypothetical protein